MASPTAKADAYAHGNPAAHGHRNNCDNCNSDRHPGAYGHQHAGANLHPDCNPVRDRFHRNAGADGDHRLPLVGLHLWRMAGLSPRKMEPL